MPGSKHSNDKYIIVALLVVLHVARCHPSGTPSSACGNMVPKHGTGAQTTVSPYTVTVSSAMYKCGESVTVNLGGSTSFKGFFCQARQQVNSDTRVGTFDITGNDDIQFQCDFCLQPKPRSGYTSGNTPTGCEQGLFTDCNTKKDVVRSSSRQAVTHTNNTEKTFAQFRWKPSENHGDVYMVCTWVQSKRRFWTREASSVMTYGGQCDNGAYHVRLTWRGALFVAVFLFLWN